MFGNEGLALPVCSFLLLHLPVLPLTSNGPVKVNSSQNGCSSTFRSCSRCGRRLVQSQEGGTVTATGYFAQKSVTLFLSCLWSRLLSSFHLKLILGAVFQIGSDIMNTTTMSELNFCPQSSSTTMKPHCHCVVKVS